MSSKPGFYICLGPDSVLLLEHIDALLREHAPGAWEKRLIWGDEFSIHQFRELLGQAGLFATPRAVVLRQAQAIPAAELKKLSALLGQAGGSAWPFVCFELDYERGKLKIPTHIADLQCVVFARGQGWYREIPPLDARSLKQFAHKEAGRLGLRLAPADLEVLAAALPPDAGAIRLEMDKVVLACPAGTLRPEALALLAYRKDIDIFAFLQELQSGRNPRVVWAQFMKDQLDSADAGLFSFLAMLLREARILWQLLTGEQVFLPPQILQNKTRLSRSLGYGKLARIWDLALAADKGVKSGERSPQQAFELLIAELFRLFNAGQGR
jgi:DNA polymerase-3 subunit delta